MTLLDAEYALKNHFDIVNADLEYNKALFKEEEYLSEECPKLYKRWIQSVPKPSCASHWQAFSIH